MNRIIFDTNVYGRFVEDDVVRTKFEKEFERNKYIVYRISIIRKELRDTPKSIIFKNKKLRILLLSTYDSFVKKKNHDLKLNPLIETLARDYFKEYKRQGGVFSKSEMGNDLIIIAAATIYQLDIIISDDERTMFSYLGLKSYKTINQRYGVKDPVFKTYSAFKRELI